MKHLTYLFIAVFVCSLAACKKSNDTNPLPYSYSNVHTYKGAMNDDQVTLYAAGNNSSLSLSYKGIPFTATVLSVRFSNAQMVYHLSVASYGQIKAYADLSMPAIFYMNGTPQQISSYMGLYITAPSSIVFTPGSIFESNTYTLSAN